MDRVTFLSSGMKKEYQVKICTLSFPDELGQNFLKDFHSGQEGDYDDYPSLGTTIMTYKTPILEAIVKFVIIRVNITEFTKRHRPWLFDKSHGLVILFRRANPDSIETARNLYLQFQKMNPEEKCTTVFIDVVPQTEEIQFPEPEGNESGVYYHEISYYGAITQAFDRIATDSLLLGEAEAEGVK